MLVKPLNQSSNGKVIVFNALEIQTKPLIAFAHHMGPQASKILVVPFWKSELNFQYLIQLDIGVIGCDEKAAFRSIPNLACGDWHSSFINKQAQLSGNALAESVFHGFPH